MNFHYEKVLGTGSYGIVYAATATGLDDENPEKRTRVAVKRLVKESEIMGCSSLCEFDILSASLGHPYIVQTPMIVDVLVPPSESSKTSKRGRTRVTRVQMSPIGDYGFEKDYVENPYHMVFERAEMDMDDFVKNYPNAPLRDRLRLFFELLLGMEWLHARRVIHRDIKPLNMLIFEDPEHPGSTAHMHVKIADFGMVRYHDEAFPSSPNAYTSMYRAPEVALECSDYNEKADVWALGAVLYYLVTGKHYIELSEEQEDVEQDILRKIVSSNEETFEDIEEFYSMYTNMNPTCKYLDELPYSNTKRPASRGPLSRALRPECVVFEDVIREAYPDDDDEIISTTASILSKCFSLEPEQRPSVSELLDEYMPVYKKLDPSAEDNRSASLSCSEQEVPWYDIDPVPDAYIDRFNAVVEFAIKVANSSPTLSTTLENGEIREEYKQHLTKPQVLVHALNALHRLYIWLAWVNENPEEQTEEDRATAKIIDAERPEVVYLVALYMFVKCMLPLLFVSFERFCSSFADTDPEISEAALASFAHIVSREDLEGLADSVPQLALHADGRPCCRAELVERTLLTRVYSFNIVAKTVWEEVVRRLREEDEDVEFDPLKVTSLVLENYNNLHCDDDLDEFIENNKDVLVK